jgi:iron complex outermembrane receptor protein
MRFQKFCLFALILAVALAGTAGAQTRTGSIEGRVVLAPTGEALHGANVLLVPTGRTTESGDDGTFRFEDVPAGNYDLMARMPGLSDLRRRVRVAPGETARVEFTLRIAEVRQQITVTASGREETAYDAFQAVTTMDSLQLVQGAHPSLGEVLEHQPGVAKRDFGPGSARPVLRGFDGDRVLILKDGIPTGALSSQSADHGEPIDVLGLERLEVVKGPATLLYGSGALGGVVNAVTPQEHLQRHPHEGFRGYVSGVGGTANAHGGGGAGFDYGIGNWMLWASGGGQRTGDYRTPLGEVENSRSRVSGASGGFGYFGNGGFFSLSGGHGRSRHGIPFAHEFHHHDDDHDDDHHDLRRHLRLSIKHNSNDHDDDHDEEQVDIASRRSNIRAHTGFRNRGGFIPGFSLTLDYTHFDMDELEIEHGMEQAHTSFRNRIFHYRGVFEQRRVGLLSGSFGFSGQRRDYSAEGTEALAPPVIHNSFAVFALQEVALEQVRLQFGGRIETNRYGVQAGSLPDRSFTGFSGAFGVHLPVWQGGAFVANYTHAYRAPALEELYNFGPHVGNLAFEIGNPDLRRERSDGIDLSLRHENGRLRAQANFFYYGNRDFVFLAPTGDIHDGLIEAEFLQGNSRRFGTEAFLDVPLHDKVALNLGLDYVNAELTSAVTSQETGLVTPAGTPLPRIPPLRGRVGFTLRHKGLSVRPQAVMAHAQERTFPTETRTPGHTVFNLAGSYTVPAAHAVHVFSVNAFNLGNRLYRNHLSLIKDLAPEMGRGVRFGYTVRLF